MEKLVIVKNLNKHYGKRHILKDVSFDIFKNEIVGFIGPNGAGKSTTMKCLCNLVIPDSGEIVINGYDLFKERENALRSQASLIEAPGLYRDMTGRKNLQIFAKMRDVSKERIKEMEEFTALGSRLDVRVSAYSMGMKQRLGLGIALLSKPKFLILDEPSSGLDPRGIIDLRNTLEDLIKTEDMSILFSTHQLGEVEKLANRSIYINNGKLLDIPEIKSDINTYILRLSDVENSKPILNSIIGKDNIEILSKDSVKLSVSDSKMLSHLLLKLLTSKIDILDITKSTVDIESIYEEVYGDIDDL
ncbi:ABC transporter ATP-binding protein [Fusibacter bizertensis]